MRRYIFYAFILLHLCVLFSACGIDKANGFFENGNETNRNPILPVTNRIDIPYSYQYLLTGIPGGWICDIGNALLFFGESRGSTGVILYEYDKSTGNVELFCKDAACQHNSERCASFSIYGNLELFDGEVYGLGSSVLKLNKDRFENVRGTNTVTSFQHYNGMLYAFTNDGTLLAYLKGSASETIIRESVPISNFWIQNGYMYNLKVDDVNGYVLYRMSVNMAYNKYDTDEIIITHVDFYRTDGIHIYYKSNNDFQLKRCDMNGHNVEELPIEHAYRLAFDDKYIYFWIFNINDTTYSENGNLYRVAKDLSGDSEFITKLYGRWPDIYPIYQSDFLFISMDQEWYIMSKNGENFQKIILP